MGFARFLCIVNLMKNIKMSKGHTVTEVRVGPWTLCAIEGCDALL